MQHRQYKKCIEVEDFYVDEFDLRNSYFLSFVLAFSKSLIAPIDNFLNAPTSMKPPDF